MSSRAWPTFRSIEFLNSRPALGRSGSNRRSVEVRRRRHPVVGKTLTFDLRGAESLRSIMGLCGLIKNHSASAINEACSKALKAGTYRFKDLRRLLGQQT